MTHRRTLLASTVAALVAVAGCQEGTTPTQPDSGQVARSGSPRGGTAPDNANTLFNSVPGGFPGAAGLPQNMPSLGYQATQTAEFGDYIALSESGAYLGEVTLGMSSWARHSDWPSYPVKGYQHPITVTLYEVDTSGSDPALGDVIVSKTKMVRVPWRPEGNESPRCAADPESPFGDDWGALCASGLFFTVDFDFSDQEIQLPDELMYGVSFNTQSWGYSPIGTSGPYNSLNLALGPTTSELVDELMTGLGLKGKAPSPVPTTGTDVEDVGSDDLIWAFGGSPVFTWFEFAEGSWPWTPAIRIQAARGK